MERFVPYNKRTNCSNRRKFVRQEEVCALCVKFRDVLAPCATETFERRLSDANEEAYSALSDIKLKSVKTATLLNILLGGIAVGRFYLGDIKGGLIKLIAVLLINAGCGVLALVLSPWILSVSSALVWVWYVMDVVRTEMNTQSVNTAKLFNAIYSTYLPPEGRRRTRAWKYHAGYEPSVFTIDAADGFSIAGFALAPFSGVLGLIFSSIGYVKLKRQGRSRGIAIAGIVYGCLWTSLFIALICAALVLLAI